MVEMKEGQSDSLGLVARLHFFTWWPMENSPCSIRVQFSFPTTIMFNKKRMSISFDNIDSNKKPELFYLGDLLRISIMWEKITEVICIIKRNFGIKIEISCFQDIAHEMQMARQVNSLRTGGFPTSWLSSSQLYVTPPQQNLESSLCLL